MICDYAANATVSQLQVLVKIACNLVAPMLFVLLIQLSRSQLMRMLALQIFMTPLSFYSYLKWRTLTRSSFRLLAVVAV